MTPQSLLIAHLNAENAHDMEATLATLHPECIFEDVAMEQLYHGREGARRYYQLWWDAFDLSCLPASVSCSWTTDGACVAEGLFTGRHVGTFLGHEPTGRSLRFQFVVLVSFLDGLMAGERFYYDLRGILRQLGGEAARSVGTAAELPGAQDLLGYR